MFRYIHLSEKRDDAQTSRKRFSGKAIASVLVVTMLASGAMGFGGGMLASHFAQNESIDNATLMNATPVSYGSTSTDVVSVAANTMDSVVEIRTESVQRSNRMGQYVSEGAGSGVIVSADGYIATNNHVIDGANKITVKLTNSKEYSATLIGTDSKTDLAVIKITADGLKPATVGASSTLKVGETVIAIGNPLGELGGTVTDGIISALDRQIEIDNEKMTLLQTNAAVNPGNSGGGLFDANGLLVGIVNAKSAGSEIEGLAFAIPIDTAKSIIDQIISKGYVSGRVYLGLTFSEIPSRYSFFYGVSQGGVYISGIASNSNAQRSGFKTGDLVTAVDNKKISSYSDIKEIIDSHIVSDVISFTVVRSGQSMTISLKLQEAQPTNTTGKLY